MPIPGPAASPLTPIVSRPHAVTPPPPAVAVAMPSPAGAPSVARSVDRSTIQSVVDELEALRTLLRSRPR